jgi:hypothetical protein
MRPAATPYSLQAMELFSQFLVSNRHETERVKPFQNVTLALSVETLDVTDDPRGRGCETLWLVFLPWQPTQRVSTLGEQHSSQT